MLSEIRCPTTRRTYAAFLALAPEAVLARSPSLRGGLHPWSAVMIPVTGQRGTAMPRPRALAFIAKEIREMVPPTLFFLAGFNLIVLTGHLLINDYSCSCSTT